MVEVAIRSLTAGYRGRKVLDRVTARIPSRRITAIIGPNGAGKSTLLKTLAGLLEPMEGEILVDARRVSARELRRVTGYVPQSPQGRPLLRVIEYVAAAHVLARGGWRIRDEDIEAAEWALEMLGIEGLADRRLDELSGGQRQLVDIAHALAKKPRILLLDEPISALDIRRQIEVLETISRLRREGVTIATVLHDLNAVLDYADHAILLWNGRVVREGVVQDVLDERLLEKVYGVKLRRIVVDGRPRIIPEFRRW